MGRAYRQRKRKTTKSSTPNEEANTATLYKFMNSKLGFNNETHLTVGHFADTGRGLYSKCPPSSEEPIVKFPFTGLISFYTVSNDKPFLQLLNLDADVGEKLTFQSLLALFICYQKSLGEGSFWHPYLKSLPDQFTNPYFLAKKELYFVPEMIFESIIKTNNQIKADFSLIQSLLHKDSLPNFNLSDFSLAYFAVNSRSVFVEPTILNSLPCNDQLKAILSDEPNMSLAPFLDLINHNPKVATTPLFTNLSKGVSNLTYELHSNTQFKKYEQIFINYGSHNNTKLLLEYGFIVKNNPADFIEITLQDIINYIKLDRELKGLSIPRQKFIFIREHGLHEHLYFDLTDGFSRNLEVVLTILFAEKNIYNMNNIAFGQKTDRQAIKEIGLRFVDHKKEEIERYLLALEKLEDKSSSAFVCIDYFEECIKFLGKIINFFN